MSVVDREAWTWIRDIRTTIYRHGDMANFEKLGHGYGMDTAYVYIVFLCVYIYIDTHTLYTMKKI